MARLSARIKASGSRDRKTARSLAAAAAKGIDLDSTGIEDLLALLHFEDAGDRRGQRRRRLPRRGRQGRQLAVEVKAGLARERGDNPLSLFNALRSAQGTWVAIPFMFRCANRDLDGTVRILYAGTRPVRLALEVRAHPGGAAWGFALSQEAVSAACGSSVAATGPAGGPAKKWRTCAQNCKATASKLTILSIETFLFDGYSAEGSGVDLLG